MRVTPFVGVWIEIMPRETMLSVIQVTPFVGVWIEITSFPRAAKTSCRHFLRDGTILKICEYNGEKCIAKELLHQKKKRATKRILQGMKGECCNNQYECRYRQDGKCLCGEEETKEILERFAERGIVKKFGSYYQYQI